MELDVCVRVCRMVVMCMLVIWIGGACVRRCCNEVTIEVRLLVVLLRWRGVILRY